MKQRQTTKNGKYQAAAMLAALAVAGVLGGCGGGSGGPTPGPTPTPSPGPTPTPMANVGRIAFTSDRDTTPGDWEIYTVLPDGMDVRRLTNVAGKDFEPAWSFDRRQITFISGRDGSAVLYVMNADGSGQRRVANNAVVNSARTPAWSPNGQQIVFAAGQEGSDGLYVIDVTGANLRHLTTSGRNPSWGSNNKIVFDAVNPVAVATQRTQAAAVKPRFISSDGRQLWVINADGTGLTQLPVVGVKEPAWSPDATQIVFAKAILDVASGISLVNADGSNERAIPNAGGGAQPSFSPNGQQIAYYRGNIVVSNIDGSQRNVLSPSAPPFITIDPNWGS